MVAQRGIYYLYKHHSLSLSRPTLCQSVIFVLSLSFEPSISKPRLNGQDVCTSGARDETLLGISTAYYSSRLSFLNSLCILRVSLHTYLYMLVFSLSIYKPVRLLPVYCLSPIVVLITVDTLPLWGFSMPRIDCRRQGRREPTTLGADLRPADSSPRMATVPKSPNGFGTESLKAQGTGHG